MRTAIVLLVIAAAGCVLVACTPRIPSRPPGPSIDPTSTPNTSESAPPVEYTGPIVEPKSDLTRELHSPVAGSAERTAILDALRGPVEAELEQPVVFKVNLIRAQGEWAFVRATPLQPGGNRIDYLNTKFREQVENGAFDDSVDALVKYTNGSWQPVIYVIGATDVAWSLWPQEYGAPEALFASP